jgi:hypothetical protein
MTVRRTFSSLAFAGDTANPELPVDWANGATAQILDWMWRSFDNLRSRHFTGIDLIQPLDPLERDLTRHHSIELQLVFIADTDGFTSLVPQHEWDEFESLTSPSAKPPAYDFAFVHIEHRRWAWPIEAKVLPTPASLAEYLGDVGKFESGIAAPLVGEGGLIGYLLSGTAEAFLSNVQSKLSAKLEPLPAFSSRPHRVSRHTRTKCPPLRLHHMIMVCK